MHSYPSSLYASQRLNSIRLPAKAAMQLLIMLFVLFLSLCLFPNLATAATPHIYDVPQAGPPGSQTTTLGNGWDPNATLDIYFDSTDVGLVDTDSNGSFGMALKAPTIRQNGFTIQIPKDAVPGQHWITAVERITQLQAQVPFTVSGDWPQFHLGPDHTGFNPYENVLSPETVGNLTSRWTYITDDAVTADPVVANGRVYITSWDGYLYALDAGTGSLFWKFPDGEHFTPAVADGVVYVSGLVLPSSYLYALDANSGSLLWSYPSGATSPAVANGVVYIGSADQVCALDAHTGALLWSYQTAGQTWAAPAVANGVVYVGADKLYALNASTGALLWSSLSLEGGVDETSPVVANGVVYVTTGYRQLYALNANTGAHLWKYAPDPQGILWSTPAVANGVVYFGAAYPDVSLYALDAGTGVLLWKYATGNDVESSPAVANGVVYVGSGDSNVYALNASTGAFLWKYATGGYTRSSPAIVDGMLYIGSGDGYLYAFGLPKQQMSEKFSPPERPDPARLTPHWSLQPSSQVTPPLKK